MIAVRRQKSGMRERIFNKLDRYLHFERGNRFVLPCYREMYKRCGKKKGPEHKNVGLSAIDMFRHET